MKYPVADAHCDFLYFAGKGEYDIRSLAPHQCMNLDRMREGGVALQFFAAWTDDKEKQRSPLQQCLDMIAAYHRMIDENSDFLVPFTADFDPSCGKTAAILAIENGSCMMDDLNNLEIFYRLGVRAMTLTWNYRNGLAAPSTLRLDTGLTELGKKTVKRMAELGMAIDLAHLGDRGIEQVFGLVDAPVFSSHTNARELFYARRSLKTEHIREIARRGGVIGVNFYVKQLTSGPYATISDIADHICFIAENVGCECVAIGSDFDGMNIYPKDMQHSGHMPRLADELLSRGMTENEVYAVMYGNLARYIKMFV